MLTLEKLQPEPAGSDLEYDQRLIDVVALLQGGDDNTVLAEYADAADSNITTIDYRKILKMIEELWGESRDLYLGIYYTIAATACKGLPGLHQGLTLLDFLVDKMWTEFYPQLDPDDDNDPAQRINAFANISPSAESYNDVLKFNHILNTTPLFYLPEEQQTTAAIMSAALSGETVDSSLFNQPARSVLNYTFRDLLCYRKALSDSNFDENVFYRDVLGLDPAVMNYSLQLVSDCCSLVSHIETTMNTRMAGTGILVLEGLNKNLHALLRFYQEFQPAATAAAADTSTASALETSSQETTSDSASSAGSAPVAAVPAPAPVMTLNSIKVTKRQDALLLVQKAIDYFKLYEPTSPAPFLLQRALRMSEMNFIDLLNEIDESAVSRARDQFGIRDNDSNS